MTAFTVELKQPAAPFDFGALLGYAVRDRFVAGLGDKKTMAELQKKTALNFESACDIAKGIMLARRESH